MPQNGPASTRERSSTRIPSSERAGVVVMERKIPPPTLLWICHVPTERARLQERILVLDGAMGTMLQAADLTAEDFGGPALEGCNEHLNLTRPDVDPRRPPAPTSTPAPTASPPTPSAARPTCSPSTAWPTARTRSRARRRAWPARRSATRCVIGAMGPSTRTITVTRNVTFDDVRAGYRVQAAGAHRRRRGRAAARDLPGHAERQGRGARRARGAAGGRRRRCR